MLSELKKLKSAALAATPGKRYWHDDGCMYTEPEKEERDFGINAIINTDGGFYGPIPPDQAFIAACDPDTILKLIAIAEEAERYCDTTEEIQHSALREVIDAYLKRIDPLSGHNVLRYAAANFTDNDDGTMSIRRPLPTKRIFED